MDNPFFTPTMQATLRSQVIDLDRPGTLLHDFQTVLDFLGPEGAPIKNKMYFFEADAMFTIDARLSRPLRLPLKRPQLRSHPYIEGLYLLLCSTGLGRIQTTDAVSRLVIQPTVLESWNGLDLTERYFTLLEAWGRFAQPTILGDRRGPFHGFFTPAMRLIHNLPADGVSFDLARPQQVYAPEVSREFYLLALLDLFGLLSMAHPAVPLAPWCPAALTPTPFGKAMSILLGNSRHVGWWGPRSDLPLSDTESYQSREEHVSAAPSTPTFGAWQPILQPYFPAWQNNLTLPSFGFREGTWIFRLSLGKLWRRIAMRHDNTLHDLLGMILDSLDFDFDHLYTFTCTNACGQQVEIGHPESESPITGDEVQIGSLPLQPGDSMSLLYDFGDNWQFTVTLEAIESPGKRKKDLPRILETRGKSPEQYPSWE